MSLAPATGLQRNLPDSLLLAGAGKMGGALLEGWLDMGLEGSRITIVDPHAAGSSLDGFRRRGVILNPTADQQKPAEVLVLAVKPQSLAAAAVSLASLVGPETLLISIVAGKTITDLRNAFPHLEAVVRAMPNTPVAVRRGMTGCAAGNVVSDGQRRITDALMRAVGDVVWLDDESDIDRVTAVSGSGPAYVFYLTECLAQAGAALGLRSDVALRLARATVEGAGALMQAQPDVAPATLRQNVTSPGGTTAAALAVMMDEDRLARTLADAVAAAHKRAGELAG